MRRRPLPDESVSIPTKGQRLFRVMSGGIRGILSARKAVPSGTQRANFVCAATVIVGAIVAAPAEAHHSYAQYDEQKPRVIEGAVESISWANPHVSFKVAALPAVDAKTQTWDVESHAPYILRNDGWTSATLTRGTRVRITCIPSRDGAPKCRLLTAFLVEQGKTLETKLSHNFKSPQ